MEGTTLRARSLEYKAALTDAFWKHALPHFESGTYKPIIDSEYPLEDTQAAHEYMESNANTGKILLKVV